jgi:hypothetical protein
MTLRPWRWPGGFRGSDDGLPGKFVNFFTRKTALFATDVVQEGHLSAWRGLRALETAGFGGIAAA